jgi:hypothetical protein
VRVRSRAGRQETETNGSFQKEIRDRPNELGKILELAESINAANADGESAA